MQKILHIVGARPNFMKIAPVMQAFARTGEAKQTLVHTGQHYDAELSKYFFEDLELPRPDVDLGVGSASHAVQTARVMIALESVLERVEPDWVFTVGDVNSTVAAALVAAKLGIRVAHVEAGLRSGDWTMPEEINRVVTDRLSDLLFTTEASANENLRAEGVPEERIHFVGNVMIDTLLQHRKRSLELEVHADMGLDERKYILVTLHRPSNVDDPERLAALLAALGELTAGTGHPVVLPLHPRTSERVRRLDLEHLLAPLHVLPPLRYLEFLGLMATAGLVVTDSGGIQEETTVLGVPCITVRPNTERPATITHGTNRLYDGDPSGLLDEARSALLERRDGRTPPLWDGHAAERIARITLALEGVGRDAKSSRSMQNTAAHGARSGA
ncbi:MAG TPA: UDP-N-acetylglucosamine 2-epimerase (non-hydrolyzing) [Gemmatimonadota bacterium]|nr:UDP-N-acetylglucosamine 2-epimerase (non-hydrolyzing) [Gemmatimonadota bacterium]